MKVVIVIDGGKRKQHTFIQRETTVMVFAGNRLVPVYKFATHPSPTPADLSYYSCLCVLQAAKLAVERGWGINIGGGFHHCSSERGGGFCAYADITLAIRFLFMHNVDIKTAMIVDLDAHQVSIE